MQSTKKGLVMTKTVMEAIMRFRIVSRDVITYCSKKINKRVMGKTVSLDFVSRSSRSVDLECRLIVTFHKANNARSF